MPIALLAAFAFIGIAGAVLKFWAVICDWFADHANPWLEKHFPKLHPYCVNAFKALDSVVGSFRSTIINSWRKIRSILLSSVINIEKNSQNKYIRTVTSYLKHKLSDKAIKVVTTEEVDWADLPEKVRGRVLERKQLPQIDFLTERDEEVMRHETTT